MGGVAQLVWTWCLRLREVCGGVNLVKLVGSGGALNGQRESCVRVWGWVVIECVSLRHQMVGVV